MCHIGFISPLSKFYSPPLKTKASPDEYHIFTSLSTLFYKFVGLRDMDLSLNILLYIVSSPYISQGNYLNPNWTQILTNYVFKTDSRKCCEILFLLDESKLVCSAVQRRYDLISKLILSLTYLADDFDGQCRYENILGKADIATTTSLFVLLPLIFMMGLYAHMTVIARRQVGNQATWRCIDIETPSASVALWKVANGFLSERDQSCRPLEITVIIFEIQAWWPDFILGIRDIIAWPVWQK